MTEVAPFRIVPGTGVEILDQTVLPAREEYRLLDSVEALCEAIAALRVRGAPLLGLIGACGVAIAAGTTDALDGALHAAAEVISGTRPTAVDLGARVRQALAVATTAGDNAQARRNALWDFASLIAQERAVEDAAIGRHGAALIVAGTAVLTHCNTGALATGGIGTALGVVRVAHGEGKLACCYVTETRPLLQGARLTAWELGRLGIPHVLLPDTAAAALLASGRVGAVIVGADRIAVNGDTANKVGTYGLAAVAARHRIPFYVAAPTSTMDARCADGAAIPIELRDASEVGGFGEWRWAPAGTPAYNPAFDVTPASLISAIVTERGVLRPPFSWAIAAALVTPARE